MLLDKSHLHCFHSQCRFDIPAASQSNVSALSFVQLEFVSVLCPLDVTCPVKHDLKQFSTMATLLILGNFSIRVYSASVMLNQDQSIIQGEYSVDFICVSNLSKVSPPCLSYY